MLVLATCVATFVFQWCSIMEQFDMKIESFLLFSKTNPKNTQMTNSYTNLSLYITFTMIYYIITITITKFIITILHQDDIRSVYMQITCLKCKQSNSHTQVSQLYVHIFFCVMVIRPWLNLPNGDHGHVIFMGNLGGVFTGENTPEDRTATHISSLFPYIHVSGWNGDDKWLRMTNAFILCNLLWKVQKSHPANREGSFKIVLKVELKQISHSVPLIV